MQWVHEKGATVMKFGIHNSSWLDTLEAAKALGAVMALWAKNHGLCGSWRWQSDRLAALGRCVAFSPPANPAREGRTNGLTILRVCQEISNGAYLRLWFIDWSRLDGRAVSC
jgi:hypothetical protein